MNFTKGIKNCLTVNNILYILVVIPIVFLLANRYPYLLITSILLVIVVGLIFFLNKKIIIKEVKPILVLMTFIFAYFILSYFFTDQTLASVFNFRFLRYDGNFFFCYILFYIFAVPFINYFKVLNLYFKIIFTVFVLFTVFGAIEYFLGYTKLMVFNDGTDAGNMFRALNSAHNATGSIYSVVSLFALIFFLNEPKKKIKFFYLAVFVICLAGLFITKSRGGYLGFAVGALYLFWINFRSIKKFLITVSVFLAGFLGLIFVTKTYSRFLDVFKVTGTVSVRFQLWQKAWYLFLKSPIFGVGFGRFNDIEAYNYQRLKGIPGILSVYIDSNFISSSSHAHNSYLQFLAETGIVGLGLLILFWVLCFRIIYKAYNFSTNIYYRRIYLSSLASIVALFALSFTENYMSSTTIMICISMLTSLSIGLSWQEKKDKGLGLYYLK
jgi:O-antigen ligase